MIGISKLYCGTVEPSDALRYGRESSQLPSHLLQFSADKRPVVVWNVTQQCNLKCVHCYAHAKATGGRDELSTRQGKELIDDLAQFGVPVLLFSGGEPLVREDLPELAAYAVQNGMRAVISTNGTLITPETARVLKDIGLSYVGISLDGMKDINDRFRGVDGAFDAALEGISNCQAAGIKGLGVEDEVKIATMDLGEAGAFQIRHDGIIAMDMAQDVYDGGRMTGPS